MVARRRLLALLLVCCGLDHIDVCRQEALAQQSEPNDDQVALVLDSIDAGIAQWKSETSFYGTFEYREGIADSKEQAVVGEFVDPETGKPSKGARATGSIVKMGNRFRYTLSISGSHNYNRKSQTVTWRSFDLFAGNGIEMIYRPVEKNSRDDTIGGSASFTSNSKNDKGEITKYGRVSSNPFFVGGGSRGNIFAELKEQRYDFSVTRLDNERLVVTAKPQQAGDPIEIRFWMGSRFPLLEDWKVGDGMHVQSISEFCDVGNGCHVGSQFIEVGGPLNASKLKRKVWLGRIWESVDLGRRAPVRADFEIAFPASTKIRGLTVMGSLGSVNLLDIQSSDLQRRPQLDANDQYDDNLVSREQRQSVRRTFLASPIWWSIVTIALGVFLFALSMRIRNSKSN